MNDQDNARCTIQYWQYLLLTAPGSDTTLYALRFPNGSRFAYTYQNASPGTTATYVQVRGAGQALVPQNALAGMPQAYVAGGDWGTQGPAVRAFPGTVASFVRTGTLVGFDDAVVPGISRLAGSDVNLCRRGGGGGGGVTLGDVLVWVLAALGVLALIWAALRLVQFGARS